MLLVASLDNRDESGNRMYAAATALQWRKLSSGQAIKLASDQAAMPSCLHAFMPSCRHAVAPSCRNAAMPQCRNASLLTFSHRVALAKAIRCCSTQTSADNNATDMNTAEHMIERYGELMTYEQLAGVLKRSESGLRVTMARRTSSAAQVLDNARIRIGRRVYFRTHQIAELIDNS